MKRVIRLDPLSNAIRSRQLSFTPAPILLFVSFSHRPFLASAQQRLIEVFSSHPNCSAGSASIVFPSFSPYFLSRYRRPHHSVMSQYPDAQFTLDTRVRPVRIIEEYTPRSKSLDLLRSTTTPSPISAARNSLDTISTLKGGHSRISSPIFLNSSVGVKPLPPALSAEQQLDESGSGSETLNSSPPSHGELRSATMPRTPSRRHEESEQLKSKFSMSPIQQSKRSKARFSQDRTSVEGVIGQEGGRGTFGNWSHSLGMAAKKLHKSTTTRKGSNDTLDVHLEVNEVTPEKSKAALRTATSLASIRRFM